MTSQFDFAIAYRLCPKLAASSQGLPYCENKLRLAEACLRSFRLSLGSLRPKIWVLLDSCPTSYRDLFLKYFDANQVVLLPFDDIGNRGSFNQQIDILLEQRISETVYFAEDDYFYVPNQFEQMLNFLHRCEDAAFISPFDHLDCYTLPFHNFPKQLRFAANHHWRTAASTCLTFLTTRNTLRKTEHIFRTYARTNSDASLWISLTKHASPFFRAHDRDERIWLSKIVAKSWLHGWQQILFGSRYHLWVPVPGIATHLDSHALSPGIDWRGLMHQQAQAASGFDSLLRVS